MYNKQQKRDVQRDNKIVNGSGKIKRSWTAKKRDYSLTVQSINIAITISMFN